MDREGLIKLSGALSILALTLTLTVVALKGVGQFSGGIRYVPPPTWYERLLGHPAFYFGLFAAGLLGLIAWQIAVRRVVVGDNLRIEHEDGSLTYWSILFAELAVAALFVHLGLQAFAAR